MSNINELRSPRNSTGLSLPKSESKVETNRRLLGAPTAAASAAAGRVRCTKP